MDDEQAYRRLLDNSAWAQFCDELKAAGEEILRPSAPKSPQDLAEGYQFLTRMVRSAFELIVEGGDASRPWLAKSLHETLKLGWFNRPAVENLLREHAARTHDHTHRIYLLLWLELWWRLFITRTLKPTDGLK